tara:strand:+ start:1051 stop:1206 length:156 start_codon:yes stop_codon:yes gene_type:complete
MSYGKIAAEVRQLNVKMTFAGVDEIANKKSKKPPQNELKKQSMEKEAKQGE